MSGWPVAGAEVDAAARERGRILAAFVELVGECGLKEVTATATIARAGTAPGSFERHFADPEECFEVAWDGLEAAYLERLAAAYEGFDDWRERFRAASAATVRLAEAHPDWARFLTVASLAAGDNGRRRQRAIGRHLVALLDTAREQLDDPAAVPEVTGRWILGIFFDRFYRRFASPDGPDLVSQLPELRFLAVSCYFGTEAGLAEFGLQP
ncbi:MAG TPA: TetR/AcrR family transcriptional regulator [Solirubrobacterales bacterium]|nr:TetR/AcrR family transcriptional regulator [Solirubrobacterales bacterium]